MTIVGAEDARVKRENPTHCVGIFLNHGCAGRVVKRGDRSLALRWYGSRGALVIVSPAEVHRRRLPPLKPREDEAVKGGM